MDIKEKNIVIESGIINDPIFNEETYVDEVIMPVLLDLLQKCSSRNIPMISVVDCSNDGKQSKIINIGCYPGARVHGAIKAAKMGVDMYDDMPQGEKLLLDMAWVCKCHIDANKN